MVRYAVLAQAGDVGAAHAAAALAGRAGPEAVAAVTAADLVHARRWSHCLEADGRATGEVVTATGTCLRSSELRGVVCRLRRLGGPPFRAPADRDYAALELHALVLSWLAGLPCPVLNRPAPGALAGPDPGPLAWLTLAARAGLRTRDARVTSDPAEDRWVEPRAADARTVLVIADRVLGVPPPEGAAACVALARLAGCEILALDFCAPRGGATVFRGADPCPPLDAVSANALAAALMSAIPR